MHILWINMMAWLTFLSLVRRFSAVSSHSFFAFSLLHYCSYVETRNTSSKINWVISFHENWPCDILNCTVTLTLCLIWLYRCVSRLVSWGGGEGQERSESRESTISATCLRHEPPTLVPPCAKGPDTKWGNGPGELHPVPCLENHSLIAGYLSDVTVVRCVAVSVRSTGTSVAYSASCAEWQEFRMGVRRAWDGLGAPIPTLNDAPLRESKKWMLMLHWSPAEAIDYILSPWCSKFCRQGADMLGLNLSRFITGKD